MAHDTSEKFVALVRLGYAARGVTYILLGYLALGTRGEARNGASSVYDYLQGVPFGTLLLWVIAIGLLAYALFKFLSAIADVQHRGNDGKARLKRIGDAASGVAYSFLAYAAYQFATGGDRSADGGESQQMAGSLLSWELGPLLLGGVGLGFLIGAFIQAKGAITASFMRYVGGRAPAAIKAIGRAGLAARAVVFALIGWSLVQSAWLESSGEVKGLGEALMSLREMGVIYTLVAVGLLLFGVFSLVVARYRVIPSLQREDLKPKL